MKFNVDLATLVKNTFGFDVKVSSFEPPNDIIPFGKINVLEGGKTMVNGAPVVHHSTMGTPVFDYIKVQAGSYYDFDGKLTPYPAYNFPYECVVEISQPTMLEQTYLTGRRGGSVDEFLGVDDWIITIRGFIINYETSDYPTAAYNKFLKTINITSELHIESPWLNMAGIDDIIVLDRNIPQVEGALHYQPFTLVCKSAIPYTVEV